MKSASDRARREEGLLLAFPALFPEGDWALEERGAVIEALRFRDLEPGDAILREGEACGSVPFVTSGSIRVFKTSDSGREITLYRIERGQSCVLSCCCAPGASPFPATVVAETAVEAGFMDSSMVKRLLDRSPAFRGFVFGQYSRRMAEVIELVEEVAFRHVDERLEERLRAIRAETGSDRVLATHRELADHIGTSREVVSRILKDWELRGLLELSRGEIRLTARFAPSSGR